MRRRHRSHASVVRTRPSSTSFSTMRISWTCRITGGGQHAVQHAASPGEVMMAGPPRGDVTPVEIVTSELGLDLTEVSGGGGAVPGGNGASQAT